MIADVPRRRAIIDRARLGEAVDRLVAHGDGAARNDVLSLLRGALADGRSEIADRLTARPTSGHPCAAAQAFLIDQIVRLIHDYVTGHVYPAGSPTAGARLTVMAVGGYGRGEMAPHSDVDIAFLTPMRKNSWTEQVTEAMLYLLWDLGLKVGYSSRTLSDMVKMSRADLTIRTALLEGRFIWGDRALYDEAAVRFQAEVVQGTTRDFIAQKLAERDQRHKRMGDSRYVVEPNVKDGKGGLRDLQTLYWIGKYAYNVRTAAELVDKKLFNMTEYRGFRRAANFFWAVRCHLHDITGRAEDRLTFDLQRDVAERMQFADRPGKSAVERFMQYYFLNAKRVGDLTGIFLAQIDEKFAATDRRLIPTIRRSPSKLRGFQLDRGRLITPAKEFFQEQPDRLIEMFHLADKHALEIHPIAMRQASRDAKLINHKVRKQPRANAMFLDILASPRDPESVLRWMNESTVFGRFIPEFGRVVAQMQFDMYHHYTVDEHSIRAIGLLSQLASGDLADEHPKVSGIIASMTTYRALSVAVLLHDIAKGRKGDHSILGAEIALELCPRLGLSDAETELVAWLVRHHLLMSATAFKRDLSDYKTIADFAGLVKSPERLKLLLVLTVVDIRAVGPGIWNSWKRQLLNTLYDAAEEVLRLGHKQHGRSEKVAACKAEVARLLNADSARMAHWDALLPESYWVAEQEDIIARNLEQLQQAGGGDAAKLSISAEYYPARGATLVTIIAADHPGLFYRIAGGIHAAGGNIIDARIHTTRDGMALDNFLVQDNQGAAMHEENQVLRLKSAIADALTDRQQMTDRLDARPAAHPRADVFSITPFAIVDNNASNRFTVIEVNAQDRPALLSRLAQIFFEARMIVHSAHIATYGERAVDTFYITDLTGGKITDKERLARLQQALVEVPKQLDEDGEDALTEA